MTHTHLAPAAVLLVEIAGPDPVHIEMSARGPKKYYEVHRPITERDTHAHLVGRSTRGATLRHPAGMTRSLCYDADTSDDWQRLIEAAWRLSVQGYQPLLEESPAGRGGHLWMIYTALVNAAWAHRYAIQVAPMLQHITECWPSEGVQKVRLPGGLYVRPGVRAWCKLYDERGGLLSDDGSGAAHVLLTRQTPAELVPAFPEAEPVRQGGKLATQPNTGVGQQWAHIPLLDHERQVETSEQAMRTNMQTQSWGDARWQQKYGRSLWFQFTPTQLAAWYNERHQVEDILPPEKNGMGLASWRGERTASVGLRADGWVDFGASARRSDGKQDGGDALELVVRVTEEAKPEVMRRIARQLVREAREAMESAAWRGLPPPTWVQQFMSPAGWQRYHALRAEAEHAAHTWGVAGFYSLLEQDTKRNTRMNEQQHNLSVQEMSDQEVTRRYAQEVLKLKNLNQFGRHSERFQGYPNTLIMNRCKRELERRGLPVPTVNPAGKDEDNIDHSGSTSGESSVSARKDDNV